MGADRSALLAGIRSFRQEILQEVNRMLDRFEDELLAACESHPEPVQVQSPANDDWMTVKQVCEELTAGLMRDFCRKGLHSVRAQNAGKCLTLGHGRSQKLMTQRNAQKL